MRKELLDNRSYLLVILYFGVMGNHGRGKRDGHEGGGAHSFHMGFKKGKGAFTGDGVTCSHGARDLRVTEENEELYMRAFWTGADLSYYTQFYAFIQYKQEHNSVLAIPPILS